MNKIIIDIAPDGTLYFLYSDELRPLMDLGKPSIAQISSIGTEEDAQWYVVIHTDASIFGPYRLLSEAQEKEKSYIEENLLHE